MASANLGTRLDLNKIGRQCTNVEYNPKRFAPCVMRIREPKCTCLVFSTGRLIVSGCKSETECRRAFRKFCRCVQKCIGGDPDLMIPIHFEVQNISANAALPFAIRLRNMAEDPDLKPFVR